MGSILRCIRDVGLLKVATRVGSGGSRGSSRARAAHQGSDAHILRCMSHEPTGCDNRTVASSWGGGDVA
eukprot:15433385-Alexandrium_andersonii.AAC.2